MRLAVVLALAATAACTDFATPAELEKATVLAVSADPPIVAAGDTAALHTIVVDGDGVLTGLTLSYQLVETYAGVAPLGRLVGDGTDARYVAPDVVPTLPGDAPAADTVQVTITGAGATPLTALKVMPIGPASTHNPTITHLAVGADDALPGRLTVHRGETRALEVATDPAAGDSTRYAWYTVAGTIAKYQSNPTDLVVDDQARSGWLFVVVRDGVGGVAWRGVQLDVP